MAGASSEWGMIHSIPIRNGWSAPDLDERAFRQELAQRTVVHFHVTFGSTGYHATRALDGSISVEVNQRKVN